MTDLAGWLDENFTQEHWLFEILVIEWQNYSSLLGVFLIFYRVFSRLVFRTVFRFIYKRSFHLSSDRYSVCLCKLKCKLVGAKISFYKLTEVKKRIKYQRNIWNVDVRESLSRCTFHWCNQLIACWWSTRRI